MESFPEGNAVVYCEGMYGTLNGKTAHGLVRRCERYRLLSVIDSTLAGNDAGTVLDSRPRGIPVLASVEKAVAQARVSGSPATHLVMGLAPDGGRLPAGARHDVMEAIEQGLHIDSGLHDFLGDDADIVELARRNGVRLRDIRRPPTRQDLHFFTGKIEEVTALKVAVLGTDSAVGKRTTAWLLVDALRQAGIGTELVGTGQTAWLQGARHSIVLDSLINDFVSGEIEHAVWSAWHDDAPQVVVVEGQGSLLNPAYPGGFEIMAAARPDLVVLQHPPARTRYDGFPRYALHPIEQQIEAIEVIGQKPVVAIAVSGELLDDEQVVAACRDLTARTSLIAVDPVRHGPGGLVEVICRHLAYRRESSAPGQ